MTPIQAPLAPREGLATVEQAAKFLHIGRTSIYAMMNANELPHTRVRNARRIPWAALHKFSDDAMQAAEQGDDE